MRTNMNHFCAIRLKCRTALPFGFLRFRRPIRRVAALRSWYRHLRTRWRVASADLVFRCWWYRASLNLAVLIRTRRNVRTHLAGVGRAWRDRKIDRHPPKETLPHE